MIRLGFPYTKREIIEAWSDEYLEVGRFFSTIGGGEFFAAPAGVWSAADNLAHLIKAGRPVAMALKIPKVVLRLRFGRSRRESRTLAAIRTEYVEVALAGGAVASGRFLPEVTGTGPEVRQRIMAGWNDTGRRLEQALSPWSEADLDRYVLPHPLLGKLSVREMLFFTLYHTMHHVNDVQRLLGRPTSEWFGQADGNAALAVDEAAAALA